MIDNLHQVERLLASLAAPFPVSARVTPELAATLQHPDAVAPIPPVCSTTSVNYAGDEGGIMCKLDFGPAQENTIYTSLTVALHHMRAVIGNRAAATTLTTSGTTVNGQTELDPWRR